MHFQDQTKSTLHSTFTCVNKCRFLSANLFGVDWRVVCPLRADVAKGQLFKMVKSVKLTLIGVDLQKHWHSVLNTIRSVLSCIRKIISRVE